MSNSWSIKGALDHANILLVLKLPLRRLWYSSSQSRNEKIVLSFGTLKHQLLQESPGTPRKSSGEPNPNPAPHPMPTPTPNAPTLNWSGNLPRWEEAGPPRLPGTTSPIFVKDENHRVLASFSSHDARLWHPCFAGDYTTLPFTANFKPPKARIASKLSLWTNKEDKPCAGFRLLFGLTSPDDS